MSVRAASERQGHDIHLESVEEGTFWRRGPRERHELGQLSRRRTASLSLSTDPLVFVFSRVKPQKTGGRPITTVGHDWSDGR